MWERFFIAAEQLQLLHRTLFVSFGVRTRSVRKVTDSLKVNTCWILKSGQIWWEECSCLSACCEWGNFYIIFFLLLDLWQENWTETLERWGWPECEHQIPVWCSMCSHVPSATEMAQENLKWSVVVLLLITTLGKSPGISWDYQNDWVVRTQLGSCICARMPYPFNFGYTFLRSQNKEESPIGILLLDFLN